MPVSLESSPEVALLAPDLSGGGGTRAYLLAQALRVLGARVRVYGFLFGDRLYPEPPAGLAVEWVRGANHPQFLARARSLLTKVQGQVLYAIKPRPTSFGVALGDRLGCWLRLQRRRPVMLDIDDWEMSWYGGDEWRYRPGSPKRVAAHLLKRDGVLRLPDYPLYLQAMERLVPWADALTVDTRFLQARFGGDYLPNGKDTDLFDPARFDPAAARAALGLGDTRLLMFPGTARPHKGLEDALEALDLLDRPEVRLAIVGGRAIDDGYLDSLSQRWPRWVVRLPQTPSDRMAEVVAAAEAIVVPQRDAPTARAQFPMKLGDAMAMAKPTIATRVGDIPEILGDTGYLCDPNSPAQLAAAIATVLDDPTTATARGLAGRDRCLAHYSLTAMARLLEAPLSQALSANHK